jgi:sugar phosphate isomerase/epimerase
MHSRRDFGKFVFCALPLARVAVASAIDSRVNGVEIGVQSYSFRNLSFVDALKAMQTDKLGLCELFSPHIEGGHLTQAPPIPWEATKQPTEEETRAAREELRKWRLTVPMSFYKEIRKRFSDAGVQLFAYNLSFDESFTDVETDRGFEAAHNLGVKVITASTTLPVTRKLIPFANKHRLIVAMHGHSDVKDPNQFAKPESFAQAVDMTQWFKINLDIGHFTAANYDPVEFIRQHHEQIVLLHLKDRKKNDGDNVPWGDGDTDIKGVLELLEKEKYPIPAAIEYEYKGSGTAVQEVAKCYAYCKRALAAG